MRKELERAGVEKPADGFRAHLHFDIDDVHVVPGSLYPANLAVARHIELVSPTAHVIGLLWTGLGLLALSSPA